MNNYNYTRPPRTGVIVFASVVFLSIFVIAIFDAYEYKAQALGHSVHLSPSSANYGTVSSAPSTVAVPMRSTAPLLSGGTIRSYAYSGHSSMPKASGSAGGFTIHTTSSASLHSYGSGGGGAGGSMGFTGTSSPSRGIQSSGIGSVSIPTLAMNTPKSSLLSASSASYSDIGGPWRIKPNGDGEYNGEYNPGTGEWWNDDDEEWSENPFDGAIKIEGGITYKYVGTYPSGTWVRVEDQADPGVPVGDTPWIWMLLLAIAYVSAKVVRKRIASLSITTLD